MSEPDIEPAFQISFRALRSLLSRTPARVDHPAERQVMWKYRNRGVDDHHPDPKQQELIDKAIRSGAYSSPDQVIGRALEVLSGEDEWLRAHRQPIHAKIGRGLAQLDLGEAIPGDQAWAPRQERKAAWLDENPETAP